MDKIAITGAGGFVAGSVIQEARDRWEVHALSNKPALATCPGLVWHTLDLTNQGSLRQAIAEIRPNVVLHAAAIADIDFCERNPQTARLVNIAMTEAVVQSCAQTGARLLFVSTDSLFDGVRGNYDESDPPSPINEYARTKVAGEGLVASSGVDYVIARTAIVMGFGRLGPRNSFLERTEIMLREGREIFVPPDEVRTPIDVITLARRELLELAAGDFRGTIHLAGNERLDRVSLTRRLAERLGFSPDAVVPRPHSELAGRAPRPRDVSLNNAMARSLLETPMRDFYEAVNLILEHAADRSKSSP